MILILDKYQRRTLEGRTGDRRSCWLFGFGLRLVSRRGDSGPFFDIVLRRVLHLLQLVLLLLLLGVTISGVHQGMGVWAAEFIQAFQQVYDATPSDTRETEENLARTIQTVFVETRAVALGFLLPLLPAQLPLQICNVCIFLLLTIGARGRRSLLRSLCELS
jgi:hypothetical protein